MTQPPATSYLTLGHVLTSLGAAFTPPIRLEDVHVIRHVLKPDDASALRSVEDLTEERILAYTRGQDVSPRRFPSQPPRYWVILIADGQRRSRLFGVYENHGEVLAERTQTDRWFDLRRSSLLAPLEKRLVVDWTSPRNWHRSGTSAAGLQVLEIADRDKVPFPGFDRVLLSFRELRDVVADRRYADWRAALSEVQGIYLITDSSTGRHYVGKADGAERILGRWTAYARDGHGGNVALRELALAARPGPNGVQHDQEHARHFLFSTLRVFGPSTSPSEVNAAESHYKNALLSVKFGLNRN